MSRSQWEHSKVQALAELVSTMIEYCPAVHSYGLPPLKQGQLKPLTRIMNQPSGLLPPRPQDRQV